jgi:hypothetical protein
MPVHVLLLVRASTAANQPPLKVQTEVLRKGRKNLEADVRAESFLGSDFCLESGSTYRRKNIFSRELAAGRALDCGTARPEVHMGR